MSKTHYRIGQIVPSSNITMETEIPAMLRARETIAPERFTFHSSRMRMKKVTQAELAAMDAESVRCAAELSDARVDVMGYACLVAIMAMGRGYHRTAREKLSSVVTGNGSNAPVVTSAGALVVDYLEAEGYEVVDAISLEIEDNLAVAARDPLALVDVARRLSVAQADAVVVSASVQMPSLAAIDPVQTLCDRPTLSAAAATVFTMLNGLGLPTRVPGAGALLAA